MILFIGTAAGDRGVRVRAAPRGVPLRGTQIAAEVTVLVVMRIILRDLSKAREGRGFGQMHGIFISSVDLQLNDGSGHQACTLPHFRRWSSPTSLRRPIRVPGTIVEVRFSRSVQTGDTACCCPSSRWFLYVFVPLKGP